MFCLIAVEQESAQIIKENLEKIYPNWQFAISPAVNELQMWESKRPDVVLVSRFLPGDEQHNILKYLPTMFPASHIVLLIGENTEQARAYIRLAEQYGLLNVVTGPLPGDRPYTIMVALKYDREMNLVNKPDINKEDFSHSKMQAVNKPVNEVNNILAEQKLQNKILEPQVVKQKETEFRSITHVERPNTKPPINKFEGQYEDNIGLGSMFNHQDIELPRKKWSSQQGILVITIANKGGVGKTTTAGTVATALAIAGVESTIVDLNLASPAVGTFFKIKPERGIEALAGRSKGYMLLEQVLVNAPKYNNLKILPGPVDKTLLPDTMFEEGQLAEIISVLLGMVPVVIVDTPSNFWDRPWLPEVFEMADLALAVVDQSDFSKEDTRSYAPYIVGMGITPEKIRLVLNRFSPKLHNARLVEKAFNEGLKRNVQSKSLPKVIATIPVDWDAHTLKGYRGEVVGLDDPRSQWHRLAEEVAKLAGQHYNRPEASNHKKGIFSFLKLKRG